VLVHLHSSVIVTYFDTAMSTSPSDIKGEIVHTGEVKYPTPTIEANEN
jgi:hypothetical protein